MLWVDGFFALHELVFPYVDLGIFVHASPELRSERRIARDAAEGRELLDRLGANYWDRCVEPGYQNHIAPTQEHAHIVIMNENNSFYLSKKLFKQG